ncbi:MAG: tyrosine-type recombinase/integrase [Bacillota bacterium]
MTGESVARNRQTRSDWCPPVRTDEYYRSALLSLEEERAIAELLSSRYRWGDQAEEGGIRLRSALRRLLTPLRDALAAVEGDASSKDQAVAALLRACGREKSSFWGWGEDTWSRVLGTTQAQFFRTNGVLVDGDVRQYMAAAAYLLGCFTDVRFMGAFKRTHLACKVFGRSAVESAIAAVKDVLVGWGYAAVKLTPLEATVCEAFLLNRSPHLHALSTQKLTEFRCRAPKCRQSHYLQFSKALAAMGLIAAPLERIGDPNAKAVVARLTQTGSIHPEWLGWIQRWEGSSTLAPATRRQIRLCLYKVGRWLQTHHPEVTNPRQWTRDLGLEWVAAVDRIKVGDYVTYSKQLPRLGQLLLPRSKDNYLGAMRTFFRDCQEWEWIPRNFDPVRVFATPRSVKALIGPDPRTISDDIWARLMWAGMSLAVADLFSGTGTPFYPIEFVRALAAIWLFAGLRSDEIVRLRLGCIRWQQDDVSVQATGETLPRGAVCLLDVPVNKTGAAFTKPVDPVVGRAVADWEQVRPRQPSFLDPKTGEVVDFLFCYRARPLMREYINGSLIPILCHKAGVPLKDVRGTITSHRARATIASQLFHSRDPMSLFELQAWLGHRSPATTQNYVAITPTKLAKAYADAGYLARNFRVIEVLIDNDAVKTATAAAGEPWRYYDLGHCFCTYEFFDQCPHRMACARCDFCIPKDSNRAQLLEAKTNLLRFLQEVPLTDEERAVADGDLEALDRLIAMLSDKPTPSGQTPKQLRNREG